MDIENRHRLGDRWPNGAVYVGRGTPLGNPYRIGSDGDRDAVVDRYADWLKARIEEGDPVVLTALRGLSEDSTLVCSCAPARCHAEVIRELWCARIAPLQQAPLTSVRKNSAPAYAGVGSRTTPVLVLRKMTRIAERLEQLGFTLRSGGAPGADLAFAAGAVARARIFLPCPSFFVHKNSAIPSPGAMVIVHERPTSEAFRIAEQMHPNWKRLSDTVRALMARDSHQILGADLRSPCDFVVCWTPDGAQTEAQRGRHTGGTGQAIALADRWGVPVFNLHNLGALDRLARWLDAWNIHQH